MEIDRVLEIYTDFNLPIASMLVTTWVLFLSIPTFALLGFQIGRYVRLHLQKRGREIDIMVAETTLAAFLSLLGLLLAFTFGNSMNYSSERKASMTLEANAIGTAFLRADLLAEPGRSELKQLLLDYAKTRLLLASDPTYSEFDKPFRLQMSLELQEQMWPLALTATSDPLAPATKVFVLSSINEVLDAHLIRIATLSLPVSKYANTMMFVAALAAVFLLGNRAGMLGRRLTWRTFFFTSFLFLVMYTIVDSQRASEGLIVVNQSPLRATIYDMEKALNQDPNL